MKNEIIRKKMKEHAERLRGESERQKEQYAREAQQLQLAHEKRIVEIQSLIYGHYYMEEQVLE